MNGQLLCKAYIQANSDTSSDCKQDNSTGQQQAKLVSTINTGHTIADSEQYGIGMYTYSKWYKRIYHVLTHMQNGGRSAK